MTLNFVPTPQTPPNRIYLGLSNMATRNQKLTEKALKEMVEGNSLAEEEIVNMIKKWRIREKDAYSEDSDESEGDLEFNILEESRDWRETTDIGITMGRKFETERREDGKEEEEEEEGPIRLGRGKV
ncbi:unnamed protein product [Rhizophagus irregularis]|nr:unnamed protein product [Rhizophagus irregularis]